MDAQQMHDSHAARRGCMESVVAACRGACMGAHSLHMRRTCAVHGPDKAAPQCERAESRPSPSQLAASEPRRPCVAWPTRILYRRQDVFAALGIAVPATWEELVDTAEALTGRDVDGDGRTDVGFCFDAGLPSESKHATLTRGAGLVGAGLRRPRHSSARHTGHAVACVRGSPAPRAEGQALPRCAAQLRGRMHACAGMADRVRCGALCSLRALLCMQCAMRTT